MTLTFNPGVNASFPLDGDQDWPADPKPAIKPYLAVMPKTLRPVRTFRASYLGLTKDQLDYAFSFFHEIRGSAGEFNIVPMDAVFSPLHRGPDLTTVVKSGAPAGARTYNVQFTWYDSASGQETKPSPSTQIAVAGGSVVKVTVPVFPMGVGAFRVYAGQVGDSMWAQAYSTLRTWEQPAAELLTLTSTAPASNNLKPLLKCSLAGRLSWRKTTANRFTLSLDLLELHA